MGANDRVITVDYTTGKPPDVVLGYLRGYLGADGSIVKTLTVRSDGSGQFASPKLANDSITDAGPGTRYTIDIGPGVYLDSYDWIPKNYVTLRGADRDTCILSYTVPVDSPDQAVIDRSTITLQPTTFLENLTVIIEGGRYAVHSEQSGANRDALHQAKNCRFVHKGHDAVNAWRTANPGSGLTPKTFNSMTPWGCGSASGLQEIHEDCVFESPYSPFYSHNNTSFSNPTRNRLTRSRLTSKSPNASGVTINSIGSGQGDSYLLESCQIDATYIYHTDASWNTDTYAKHLDYSLVLDHCNPVGYYDESRGLALTVMSGYGDPGQLSTVRVTGNAVPVIFGVVTYRDGTGDAGYLGTGIGALDISGITLGFDGHAGNNTLGKKLGDRRTSPLTLTAYNQGFYEQSYTFNQDYRAMTNAQIINLVNAAWNGFVLGSANPADDYYPRMLGHERKLVNTGSAGAAKWSAVAYQPGKTAIKPMGTSEAVSNFAGVLLERTAAGSAGRFLREGIMRKTQLAGLTGTLAAGTVVYFSDTTTGQFSLTGTRVFGTARTEDWVAFKAV